MQIRKVKNLGDLKEVDQEIQTAKGPVTFKAVLSEDEARFVMEVGINVLYAHGAIPFLVPIVRRRFAFRSRI